MTKQKNKKPIGILIFTNQEVVIHKMMDGRRSEGKFCYWYLSRFPKKFKEAMDKDIDNTEFRLYMAVNGVVRGYFVIDDFDDYEHPSEIHFDSESWHSIKDGERFKPSQGWRYFLHPIFKSEILPPTFKPQIIDTR